MTCYISVFSPELIFFQIETKGQKGRIKRSRNEGYVDVGIIVPSQQTSGSINTSQTERSSFSTLSRHNIYEEKMRRWIGKSPLSNVKERIQFDLWVCYLCKHELLRRLTISEEWEYIDFIYWKCENQVHLIYPVNEEKKMNETKRKRMNKWQLNFVQNSEEMCKA